MFETVELPAGVPDLDAGLANVDRDALPHRPLPPQNPTGRSRAKEEEEQRSSPRSRRGKRAVRKSQQGEKAASIKRERRAEVTVAKRREETGDFLKFEIDGPDSPDFLGNRVRFFEPLPRVLTCTVRFISWNRICPGGPPGEIKFT